ncbi:hypothetical protein SDC9_118867 [bioreactor metagenome]|uniref:Uncharacterized protein n=1 Tax=bioreactor metagenome TaxID=1076179 RepID=A0A645C239_9ZZZZ
MPRSQRITFSLPPAIMYSADIIHSSIVAARPLFSRIGTCVLPSSFSNSKFCILRAPTCIKSTLPTNWSNLSADIISVTIGSPFLEPASLSISSPFSFKPWKEYGEVRGLKAPPRNSEAPASLTDSATEFICSSVSIEQGPAITANFLPPICTLPTLTTVFSGWNIRLARLKGSCTRITFST